MKKLLSILLVVLLTIQTTMPAFASKEEQSPSQVASTVISIDLESAIQYDDIEDILVNPKFSETYGFLDENQVLNYKLNADEQLTVNIEGYLITYYKGDHYVVVDEEAGISLITFDEDETYINGVFFDMKHEDASVNSLSGTLIRSHTHTFNVASLTIGVIAGLVVGFCAIDLVVGAVTGSLSSTIASFFIPDELQPVVQLKHYDYMQVIDYFIGIYDWTYYSYLYYGTAINPTKHFVDSWVKTVRRLQ